MMMFWGKGDSERERDLPAVTQQVRGQDRVQPRPPNPQSLFFLLPSPSHWTSLVFAAPQHILPRAWFPLARGHPKAYKTYLLLTSLLLGTVWGHRPREAGIPQDAGPAESWGRLSSPHDFLSAPPKAHSFPLCPGILGQGDPWGGQDTAFEGRTPCFPRGSLGREGLGPQLPPRFPWMLRTDLGSPSGVSWFLSWSGAPLKACLCLSTF